MRSMHAYANSKTVLCAAALIGLTLASLPTVASAQQNTNLNTDGSLYGRLSAGAIIPRDVGVKPGSQGGLTVNSGSATIKSKAAAAVSGSLGYRFNNVFAVEGEFGYAKFKLDEITGSGTVTSGGTTYNIASGTSTIDGDIESIVGMANLIIHIPTSGVVEPYLGGGVGFVNWDISLSRIGTLTCSGSCSDSGTDLAAAGIVGIDFNLAKNLSAGLRYKYLWTDTGTGITDDVTAHIAQASLKFTF